MSDQAVKFLENWVTANVRTVSAEDQVTTAESLAASCIADAAKIGIAEEELQDASSKIAEMDVVSYMAGAIDAAAMADLETLTTQDDEPGTG